MDSLAVREDRTPARSLARAIRGALPGPDSGWWLVAAGVAFTAAQLLSVSPRMGLSWDESVYASQVSGHAPAAWFDAARSRGVPLLVAPVAALTSSVAALRVYLSVASGLGLTLALWTWRRLRPAWVLGLAGVLFGGLWVAQYYGPQAMPDVWSALGGLAAVGCFLRCTRDWALGSGGNSGGREEDGAPSGLGGSKALAGLGASVAFVTLVRPGDAVYLAAPLVLAAILVWRRWRPAAAIVVGLLAGGAEWVIEAYARFGGLASRLRAAGAEQGGFGLHFALPAELRALNGPTLCRPCMVGVRDPVLDLWWFVLPVLVALGILAARRSGQGGLGGGVPPKGGLGGWVPPEGGAGRSGGVVPPGKHSTALLAAVCGLCLAAQYVFMINYAAPRFLLPAYALFAIPVADGLAFLVTGVRWDLRPAVAAVVTCFLVAQLFTQHLVLDHEAGGTVTFHDDYARIAAVLAERGVRPPCVIQGVQYIPIAFYAGCASAGNPTPGEHAALLVQAGRHPPSYARNWLAFRITGTTVLKVSAYIR